MVTTMRGRALLPLFLSLLPLVVAFCLGIGNVWIFRMSDTSAGRSLWQLLLDDRWTLGFARFSGLIFCVYAIVSVPMLIYAGRWVTAFGPSGMSTEAALHTHEAMRLKVELDRKERELESTIALANRLTVILEGGSLD